MRKQKPFAHFDNIDTFKSKKISSSSDDTTYINWEDDVDEFGSPEIYFDTICFIECEQKIFTHGSFWDCKKTQWTEL